MVWLSYAIPGSILTMWPRRRASRTSWTSWSPICFNLSMYTTRGAFLREIPLPLRCDNLIRGADFIITDPFVWRNFIGSELHVVNCPGFTGAELDLLSEVDSLTGHLLFSINLGFFKLTGCNNFTIRALKDMVKVRGTDSPWDSLQRKKLQSLEVSGYGTALAVEDGELFSDYLEYFSWDGKHLRNFLILMGVLSCSLMCELNFFLVCSVSLLREFIFWASSSSFLWRGLNPTKRNHTEISSSDRMSLRASCWQISRHWARIQFLLWTKNFLPFYAITSQRWKDTLLSHLAKVSCQDILLIKHLS